MFSTTAGGSRVGHRQSHWNKVKFYRLPTSISTYWNASWGVYVRHYKNGVVLVNPNATDSNPITLDHTYYQVVNDGDGGVVPADGSTPGTLTYQAVKGLTVCSDCAAILLD